MRKSGVRDGSPRSHESIGATRKKRTVMLAIRRNWSRAPVRLIIGTMRGSFSKYSLRKRDMAVGMPFPMRMIMVVVRVTTSAYRP